VRLPEGAGETRERREAREREPGREGGRVVAHAGERVPCFRREKSGRSVADARSRALVRERSPLNRDHDGRERKVRNRGRPYESYRIARKNTLNAQRSNP
jgi:hypothetical protein